MPANEQARHRSSSHWWVIAAVAVLLAGAGVLALRHRNTSHPPSSFADQCLALAHASCDSNDRCLGQTRTGIVASTYGADHASCLELWAHRCARGHWCDSERLDKNGKDVPIQVSPAAAAAAARAVAKASCSTRGMLPGPGLCVPLTGSDGALRSD